METAKFESLERSVTVKIQNNSYTIDFPKMGQVIDIEANKIRYSGGQYAGLVSSGLISTNLALDLIETAATFLILIPELKKDLKIDLLFNLELPQAMEIVKAYKKQFMPWYIKIVDACKELEEDEEEKEKELSAADTESSDDNSSESDAGE